MEKTEFKGESPPLIDLGIIERSEKKRAAEAQHEMEILADLPLQLKIQPENLTFTLWPPSAGKIQVITTKLGGIFPKFGELANILKDENLKMDEAAHLLERGFNENIDAFVEVVQILGEPNGKPLRVDALSLPKEEVASWLTSKRFQAIIREAFKMLDLFGLKKNLPAGANG